MAENEIKEEVDNDEVPTAEPVGEEVNLDDITYEQALAWKKEADEARKAKSEAERKIVELKREKKNSPDKEISDKEAYTKEDAMVDKFVSKNPSLEGYEDDLKKYLSKGVSLDEAKILVENKDKSIKNRNVLEKTSITHSEWGSSKKSFSYEELDKMGQKEYNEAMGLIESGKATRR